MSTRLRLLVCALATALLPSCVYMQEPFSDDETSVADPRLIGWWEDRDLPIEGRKPAFEIRKREGTKNTLETWQPLVEGDPRAAAEEKLQAMYVRSGKPALMCVESKEDARQEGAEETIRIWLPYKYDLPDERTLRLFPLDYDFVRAAIRSGELAGDHIGPFRDGPPRPIPTDAERRPLVIDIGQDDAEADDWHILLKSSAADVLEFIEKHGDKAFDEEPIVLKRVPENRRPSRESTKPAKNEPPSPP
ncbi:MAG: hypothetical protein WD066_04275 [Planctomycetaceae bacterium]